MPAAPEPLRLRSTRSYRHLAPPVSPRHTLSALPAERDACNPLCINSFRELQRVSVRVEPKNRLLGRKLLSVVEGKARFLTKNARKSRFYLLTGFCPFLRNSSRSPNVTRTKNSLVNTLHHKQPVFDGLCIPAKAIDTQETVSSSEFDPGCESS